MVTAYRPNANATEGTKNSYTQQREFFNTQDGNQEPRHAVLEDLTRLLQTWHDEGDQLILLMDCNEDVTSPDMTKFLTDCNLKDIIQTHNLGPNEKAPHTYIDRSTAIDGIFVSTAGYCGFHEGIQVKQADHCCLWVDFRIKDLFGHRMAPIIKMPSRRFTMQDPRVIKRFLDNLWEFTLRNHLLEQAEALSKAVQHPISPEHQALAEELDQLKQEAYAYADRRCCKLQMGGVPYSPNL